jgi:hypothetical protein
MMAFAGRFARYEDRVGPIERATRWLPATDNAVFGNAVVDDPARPELAAKAGGLLSETIPNHLIVAR